MKVKTHILIAFLQMNFFEVDEKTETKISIIREDIALHSTSETNPVYVFKSFKCCFALKMEKI